MIEVDKGAIHNEVSNDKILVNPNFLYFVLKKCIFC